MDNNLKIDMNYPMPAQDINLLIDHARKLRNRAIYESCRHFLARLKKPFTRN